MSDPSTREQIRAAVIEILATTLRTRDIAHDADRPPWEGCSEILRQEYRKYVVPYVDALDAAGMLVTAMEGRFIGRGMLRRTRYVTDWREPEEETE